MAGRHTCTCLLCLHSVKQNKQTQMGGGGIFNVLNLMFIISAGNAAWGIYKSFLSTPVTHIVPEGMCSKVFMYYLRSSFSLGKNKFICFLSHTVYIQAPVTLSSNCSAT